MYCILGQRPLLLNKIMLCYVMLCVSLLIALSLTDDGRLSTLLKCSAHLSEIASLSVRSVLQSALSSGVTPELFGP